MTTATQASQAQQALFQQWAAPTDFKLDAQDSPKRQFCILAKRLGWTGGEEPWNSRWEACFGERYAFRGPALRTTDDAVSSGGRDTKNSAHDKKSSGGGGGDSSGETTKNPIHDNTRSSGKGTTSVVGQGNSNSNSNSSSSHVWAEFDGFVPIPSASFNSNFRRLAKHCGWTSKDKEKRRELRVKLFAAEWEHQFGSDVKSLQAWQKFCRLCHVDPIPASIQECIVTLKELLVNIYDVLDSERTGQPLVPFDDWGEFLDYTKKGHIYPLKEAKEDTFLHVFLKELSPKYGQWDKPAE